MSRLRAWTGLLLGLTAVGQASAGAFIFAEDFPDAVTHPQIYSGSGGERPDLTVCLDRSINASLTSQAEPAVIKAIDTWNRGRSLGADNYALNNATDIASGYDFESVLLHELGHCQGLNHANHASESGFNDPQANGTKSAPGPDGVLNQGAGSDGIHGSRDDLRGDDVNLHWYLRGQNNPGLFNPVADSTTMARELNFLPSGHRFAANADRSVMAALGFANSEAVMQQGTPPREAKRHLHHDDLMTIRFARSGLNRVQGNSDDYRYRLRYVGRLSNPSNADCNVRIRIDTSTGFAVCGVSATAINGNTSQWRITQAQIAMNSQINWYYSPGPNTVTQISSTSPNPSPVGQGYTVSVRVSKGSGISISGNPFGTVEVDDGQGASCSFELASAMNGQGSCVMPGGSAGPRILTARYLGRGGFDYSEATASHSISNTVATTTTITSRVPSSTVVGQSYSVSVSVTANSGTPTGSVQISDGSNSCQATLSAGSMSCALPSTSAGTRTLSASYTPSGSFAASSGSASHVISRASTVFASGGVQPAPSAHGQTVSVSFALASVAPSTATPMGTVTVQAVPGGQSCSASAASGACSLTLFGVGSRSLNLNFAQTADFNAASASLSHQVVAAGTSTRIESVSPTPVRVGQPYDVLVRVESANVVPDGSVQISEAASGCTAFLSGGAGSCRLVSAGAGTRMLEATYDGSGNFLTSGAGGSQSVLRGATALRVIGLYPQPSPVDSTLQVRWALDVLAPAAGSPEGMVTVTAGPGESCSAALAAGGCALGLGAAGPRSLQFSYAGSVDFEPASAVAAHLVDADALFASGLEAIEAGVQGD